MAYTCIILTLHRQSCQQMCGLTPEQTGCCRCTKGLLSGRGPVGMGIPDGQEGEEVN